MTPLYNAWHYFPESKGLVTGIILCGSGLGSFIFGLVSTSIVNPDNLKTNSLGVFPEEVSERVPHMIRTMALFWSAIAFLTLALFQPMDHEKNLETSIQAEEDILARS